tara:strand:+ start:399 stop:998 length:600 start_codon:yes stop_codon:yes gene_type:complete
MGCNDSTKSNRVVIGLDSVNETLKKEIPGSKDRKEKESTPYGFILPEEQKVIQCEEGGRFKEYDSGPDKGKFGPTPTGIYFWYVIKFDEKEIFYTHESFHREQSRAEIINGTLKGRTYDLTYDEETLYGKIKNTVKQLSGEERTILRIDRTTLIAVHYEEDALAQSKHVFNYKCELISGEEWFNSILRQKDSFTNKRQI